MRLRSILFSSLLLAGVLAAPALARPCCEDCPSWPNLDWNNDSCARVCLMCGGSEASNASPDAATVAWERIFAAPDQGAPAAVCQ